MKKFSKILVQKEICVGADCDSCGAELKPCMRNITEVLTFHGALKIEVEGASYGEFLDGERGRAGILCPECARRLFENYPFLKDIKI